MALVPFAQFGPDRSTFDPQFCDIVLNCLPLPSGYGPFPSFTAFSLPLPETPMGAYLAYVANGAYRLFVGTATKLYMFDITTLGWIDKTRLAASTVINGDFSVAGSWTLGTGVSIAGGLLVFTAVASGVGASQAQTLTVGRQYKITYTISAISAGSVRAALLGGTTVNGVAHAVPGTYTDFLTAVTGNASIALLGTGASTSANIDNVSVQLVNDYNTAAGVRWSMAQFGEMFVAANGADPPQWIDTNSVDVFADMPNAPVSRNIAAVGDFIFTSNMQSNQRGVQWSGLNQPFFWTPRERSSDFQNFPDGGEIMDVASNPDGVVIFHAESIREGRIALDTPLVFNFKQTVPNHGCLAPKSIIPTGAGIFYYSDDGFYKYGTPPTPIGIERVDRWFQENCQNSDIYDMYGAEDPNRKIVYWAFRSINNQLAGTYDKVLLYHYGIDQWSLLDPGIILSGLISATTPGYTLDGLNVLGLDLDHLPFSLDSRAWSGSTPLIAAFDQQRRLGYFAGEPMPATIQTVDTQITDAHRTHINGFRPLVDAPVVHGRTATKERPGGDTRWRDPVPNNVTGMIPQITSGMFHRFEVVIPAQRWSNIHGVYPVDAKPDGVQ